SETYSERNYASYAKARLDLAREHPDNPIGALDMLSISEEVLKANIGTYHAVLDDMVGRAKTSEYYGLARAKLAALAAPIVEGRQVEWPEGQTPSGGEFDIAEASPYTLIEFWAAWCVPCREQNPEWNALLSRF